jgi:hypothetical protein
MTRQWRELHLFVCQIIGEAEIANLVNQCIHEIEVEWGVEHVDGKIRSRNWQRAITGERGAAPPVLFESG